MAQFDFKATFDKIGKIFVQGLSKRIKQQKGIDGSGYSAPAPSTIRSRKSLKGKAASASTKRLLVTYNFANEGFGYIPYANGVKVFAKPDSHRSGKATYEQIVQYNSRGQSKLNANISSPPLVFPSKPNEVLLMTDEMEMAKRIFAADAKKQLREMATMNLKVKLSIG